MDVFERYMALDVNTALIGLEKGDENGGYFCTPAGAKVFGWENGIHYCFIDGFGKTVFAVNPESCADVYVYPLARNFEDFLGLILYSGSVTAIEQIVWMSKEKFEEFVKSGDNAFVNGQKEVLDAISSGLGVLPMENAYEYVKKLQNEFDYGKIRFTDEYYDTLGLPYPGGGEPENGFEFEEVIFAFYKNTTEE